MGGVELFVESNEKNQFSSLTQSYINDLEREPGYILPDREITVARNVTIVSEDRNVTITLSTKICGLPGFCAVNAYNACVDTPIISCDHCGVGRSSAYIFFAVLLGMFVVVGNLIVILVTKHRYHNKKMNKTDLCRTSLAFADLLLGLNFTITTIINFSWTIHENSIELDLNQLLYRRSLRAKFGGMVFIYGFISSIYHLFYMSLIRFYAIKHPVKYQVLRDKKVKYHLLAIWIFVLIPTTIPIWFPSVFSYAYNSSLLLFFPSVLTMSSPAFEVSFILMNISMTLPFVLSVIATIGSGIILRKKNQCRSNLSEQHHRPVNKRASKREVTSYQTLALMLLGFSIPPIPIIVVAVLHITNSLSCSETSQPMLVGITLSLTTSFINVIIYSAKDKSFRKAVRAIYKQLMLKTPSALFNSTVQSNEIAMVQRRNKF